VKGLGCFIEATVIAAKLADGTTTNERCLEQNLAGLLRSVELWGSEDRCPYPFRCSILLGSLRFTFSSTLFSSLKPNLFQGGAKASPVALLFDPDLFGGIFAHEATLCSSAKIGDSGKAFVEILSDPHGHCETPALLNRQFRSGHSASLLALLNTPLCARLPHQTSNLPSPSPVTR
jgi:hypothetical protein